MQSLSTHQDELGISFRDPELLLLALIHGSYLNENPGAYPQSNERLEFLGDALIGTVVAHELYRSFPDRPEGELTQMRASLVRGDALARVGETLGMGQRLLMGKGEEASGGRERDSNLAGAFEALVGAVFLDQGYEAAREYVLRLLSDEFDAIGSPSVFKNPKSALQELVQSRGLPPPTYRTVDVAGKKHVRMFTSEVLIGGEVKALGRGRRKSLAEQDAAREALRAMEAGG